MVKCMLNNMTAVFQKEVPEEVEAAQEMKLVKRGRLT